MKLIFCILNCLLLLNCFDGRPAIPNEVQDAHKALQKLRASTQTGVNLNTYGQLVIEAKTSVNLASSKLPPVPPNVDFGRDDVPGGMLTLVNYKMQSAMDTYQNAGIALRFKFDNKKLIDAAEGKAIQTKYNIANADMDADAVIQRLWYIANLDTLALQGAVASQQ